VLKINKTNIDHYHNITDTSDMVIFLSTQGLVISTHHALMENNEEYLELLIPNMYYNQYQYS
jgi:hypothetical protein